MASKIKRFSVVMTLSLLIFLILTLLIPFLSFYFTSSDPTTIKKDVTIIGHRGAAGLAPENTLAAFQKGMDVGADVLELDVHLTKDDSLIVIHDHSVDRTTNGKGEIGELTYAEIEKLDAGSWFDPKFSDQKIPTLDQVLKLVKGKKKVLIELKWPSSGIYPNLVKKVVEVIRANHAEEWTIVQSFVREYLSELYTTAPEIKMHQLVFGKSNLVPIYFEKTMHFGNFKPADGAASVNIFYMYVNKKLLSDFHSQNKTVYAFTIDKAPDMLKAANLGVDGIITDFPDLAVKTLRTGSK